MTPRISRVITPAPLSNVTRGELEFDPPPLPLLQNGYSRATAFRTSPFTRVNGSRVLEFIRSIKIEANGSLSRAKEKHIYIYIHIRNEDLFVVGPCPNRHVTNGVTSVTDTDLLSLSLSLFGYLRSRSDL